MKKEISENKILCVDEKSSISALDIEKKLFIVLKQHIKKNKKFVLMLDMGKIKNINLVLKKYNRLYKFCLKNNIEIGEKYGDKIILAYIYNSDKETLDKLQSFFYALIIEDTKARYTYIYNKACDELDEIFRSKNLCDFKNDSCISQRMNRAPHKTMGCCYSFYYGKDGIPVNTGLCKYLSDKGCTVKCLRCKMFTCKYLRKKGIKFLTKDFLLLDIFLNRKQKKYLEGAFFKPQEEIIQWWLNNI